MDEIAGVDIAGVDNDEHVSRVDTAGVENDGVNRRGWTLQEWRMME